MRREMREKDKTKAVAINTMPLWSVGVMMVRGGDCPGSRPPVSFEGKLPVSFEAKLPVLFEAMTRV